ncbi:MAG TPA: methyltransferase domain-containing protein [Nitrospiraceae bacterium]|nr:methyltransferase domain-containing protein [Nitrospiraceae bacterium]
MLEQAASWIENHSIQGEGIIISSRQRICYPEVTGYLIPTLLSLGKHDLAAEYARWLVSIQRPDGSFGGGKDGRSYAFDTGQVVRGWVSLVHRIPELKSPLGRACDWLISSADSSTGRLPVPPPGADWSLDTRGEVSEGIHLYVLPPLRQAGEVLKRPQYVSFADKALRYYLRHVNVTDFTQANALTHFFAYMQEALVDLGCETEARAGMASVAKFQQSTGAVPGYHDVPWVCSTGLAQLALVWYRLGEKRRADAALKFLSLLQNPSGGFFGSYGVGATYFATEEISWATKYVVEACHAQIARHFDHTVSEYQPAIDECDGRVQALLSRLGDLNGLRVLDAGCGKGRYSAVIKRRFPGADVIAMDVSAAMLEHVPPDIKTLQHSILNMPFPDGSFDAVICVEALEHVVQTGEGVKELARVVAPGGTLAIIDKNQARLGALAMPNWEHWFKVEELQGLMVSNGIEAQAKFIGHDQVTTPDGLFVCWAGKKRTTDVTSRGEAPVLCANGRATE